jgi:hypothetical protein
MQRRLLRPGVMWVTVSILLVSFAAGPVTAQVSFDDILTATVTCTVEGEAPIMFSVGAGQWNGCSDGVRGTETMGIIDRQQAEVMNLLFAVGNFPCSGTQSVTWRTGDQQSVCGGSSEDATITPRDARATVFFSFPEPVALQFDLAVSGVTAGTTQLTVNGTPVSASGVFSVTHQEFTVDIFVSKEAPGQVVGDFIVQAASGDTDHDGIADGADTCPASDVRPTVIIDECDSDVPNLVFDDGCTIADLVMHCAEGAKNHGMFVKCVTQVSRDLERAGAISKKQQSALKQCAVTAHQP